MIAAMLHCPKCNSPELSRLHRHFWDRLMSLLLGLYPFSCDHCGHNFRTRYHPAPPAGLD
ncbi:MAG: hypothetical protein EPO61_00430 [Nitrospirae bacterium]|nr:MAG: hypothetical protein EPO61_00430 [Nitrospirota bacterium]